MLTMGAAPASSSLEKQTCSRSGLSLGTTTLEATSVLLSSALFLKAYQHSLRRHQACKVLHFTSNSAGKGMP